MRDQKHSFALYYHELAANLERNKQIIITTQELVHRVFKILRLQVGDKLTLFNDKINLVSQIGLVDKKNLVLTDLTWHKPVALKPQITIALGVLKKENFEQALYSCVELGASNILPIVFAKSIPQKLNFERIEKILISAAEQSKNFGIPVWHEPILFTEFLSKIKSSPVNSKIIYIYCDINGTPMLPIVSQLSMQVYDEIVLIIGPEGDLTTNEQTQLLSNQVLSMQLTPTVLRSFQAVTVALGALRSLL